MNESDLVRKILNYLNNLQFTNATKTHGNRYSAAQPDIDCVSSGVSVKIEVKVPGNFPTPRQLAAIEAWRSAGSRCFWTDNLEEVVQVMQNLQEMPILRPVKTKNINLKTVNKKIHLPENSNKSISKQSDKATTNRSPKAKKLPDF